MTSRSAVVRPTRRLPLRRFVAAGLALAVLSAGVAQAQPAAPPGAPPGAGAPPAAMFHPMVEPFGPGMAGGPMVAERLLDAAGASAAQKARVREILQAAHKEQRRQAEGERALHQQMLALLLAPQVDAAAAEALRQQLQARHDGASKRHLQAMLDAGAVLTPEQRQTLAARLNARREMMERHRRERQAG